MRRAAKIDANHLEIVSALRKIGASVRSLAAVGAGCPDLLVGWQGRTLVMEIKNGKNVPSHRKLTADEAAFFATWKGEAHVVESVEQAIKAVIRRGDA